MPKLVTVTDSEITSGKIRIYCGDIMANGEDAIAEAHGDLVEAHSCNGAKSYSCVRYAIAWAAEGGKAYALHPEAEVYAKPGGEAFSYGDTALILKLDDTMESKFVPNNLFESWVSIPKQDAYPVSNNLFESWLSIPEQDAYPNETYQYHLFIIDQEYSSYFYSDPIQTKAIVAAVDYFSKESESGNKDASYKLGMMYLTGNKVKVCEEMGLFYLGRAHTQGHPEAAYQRAEFYMAKPYFLRDTELAQQWYKYAAATGHELARTKIVG